MTAEIPRRTAQDDAGREMSAGVAQSLVGPNDAVAGRTAVQEPLCFHLACIPPKTSHHAKRIVRVGQWSRLADKPELVSAKATLDALLLPHQPSAPLTGPLRLELVFTWPWRASESKRVRALGHAPMTSRPDADNCSKTITDRLMALRFIEDDAAIVDLHVQKWWGPSPGIQVTVISMARLGVGGAALALPTTTTE